MKIIHQDGFSPEELDSFRPIIFQNVLESAQAIVIYMQRIGQECSQHNNRMLAEKILDYKLEILDSKELFLSQDIADAIHQL
ncbi:hypothetical protein APHAL10511_002806 [Amanita phalloides]|nr:hypothetical protein APHAL10511_002806 [Amanita phalloides]